MKFIIIALVSFSSLASVHASENRSAERIAESSGKRCEEKAEASCCPVSDRQSSENEDPSAHESPDRGPKNPTNQELRIFRNPRI